MKVVVDYDVCASTGACMQVCPEVFEVRSDGYLYILQEEPGEELRDKVTKPPSSARRAPSPSRGDLTPRARCLECRGMTREQVKGQLELLILSVLDGAPRHGYAIISAVRDRSDGDFDLPEGTVYPALHRMEGAGPGDEHVGGRRRAPAPLYSLSATAPQRSCSAAPSGDRSPPVSTPCWGGRRERRSHRGLPRPAAAGAARSGHRRPPCPGRDGGAPARRHRGRHRGRSRARRGRGPGDRPLRLTPSGREALRAAPTAAAPSRPRRDGLRARAPAGRGPLAIGAERAAVGGVPGDPRRSFRGRRPARRDLHRRPVPGLRGVPPRAADLRPGRRRPPRRRGRELPDRRRPARRRRAGRLVARPAPPIAASSRWPGCPTRWCRSSG